MHNGCVLWGGVGTGKTITALEYARTVEADKKIVVITTAKKRDSFDWEREAALLAIPVDGIEVASWNKIKEFEGRTGEFFIFDEQRLVGTGAWVKSFYKIAKQNHWILLSATPGDSWSDYAPMFIANGYYKNITEFRTTHAVYSRYTKFPKIERYIGEGRLQKYRKHLLVEMPMIRHTTRHMHHVECDFDQELLDVVRKKRWHVYEDKPLKNAAELFGVMRKIVSTDSSRVSQMESLISKHPKLIVFYNFNYELEILRNLLRCLEESRNHTSNEEKTEGEFGWAEWNGHKHEPIPDTDSWVYLVQYASGSEGWNCTSTDAMAFWSLTYSYKQFWQAQGRIDRMNTPFNDLHYYVLMSKSYAERPVIRALEMKKDFQPR